MPVGVSVGVSTLASRWVVARCWCDLGGWPAQFRHNSAVRCPTTPDSKPCFGLFTSRLAGKPFSVIAVHEHMVGTAANRLAPAHVKK